MSELPKTAEYGKQFGDLRMMGDAAVVQEYADAMRDELLTYIEMTQQRVDRALTHAERLLAEVERLTERCRMWHDRYAAAEAALSDALAELERLRGEIRRCYAALHEEFGNWPPDAAEDFIARRYADIHPDVEVFDWTCPRCGLRHPSTEPHCPCEIAHPDAQEGT